MCIASMSLPLRKSRRDDVVRYFLKNYSIQSQLMRDLQASSSRIAMVATGLMVVVVALVSFRYAGNSQPRANDKLLGNVLTNDEKHIATSLFQVVIL